jgi:predicted PurR-regulated permease PerM
MNQAASGRDGLALLFHGVLVLARYLAFRVVATFLARLDWAAMFAMVPDPVQGRLARPIGRPAAAAATTGLAAISPRTQ